MLLSAPLALAEMLAMSNEGKVTCQCCLAMLFQIGICDIEKHAGIFKYVIMKGYKLT